MEKSTKNILGLYGGILAFYGALLGAGVLINKVHHTRSVDIDGQKYFVSQYGGKTEVSRQESLACSFTLVDYDSNGKVDSKRVTIGVARPGMNAVDRLKPTLEDQVLFDNVLRRDNEEK